MRNGILRAHVKDLEAERDAFRADANRARTERDMARRNFQETEAAHDRVFIERDEAKGKLEIAEGKVGDLQARLNVANTHREDLQAALAKAERKRDQARDALAKLKAEPRNVVDLDDEAVAKALVDIADLPLVWDEDGRVEIFRHEGTYDPFTLDEAITTIANQQRDAEHALLVQTESGNWKRPSMHPIPTEVGARFVAVWRLGRAEVVVCGEHFYYAERNGEEVGRDDIGCLFWMPLPDEPSL